MFCNLDKSVLKKINIQIIPADKLVELDSSDKNKSNDENILMDEKSEAPSPTTDHG